MKPLRNVLLIVLHIAAVLLFSYVVFNGIQLRWRLGYVLFWSGALTGMAFWFARFNNNVLQSLAKPYAVSWIILSVIGLFFTFITYDHIYCETDRYLVKESSSIIGFDTTILYEKRGLKEVELQRYKGVYPKYIIPLDSIGAIVVYGEFYNGETWDNDVGIMPLDDSFDSEKATEYARKHNIGDIMPPGRK